jgi:DNA-binding response OmpR family regulator
MNKIILVEDDPVIGRGLVVNLELEGYAVQWAHDLHQAKLLIEKNQQNLIILDLGLPDGNGLDILKKVRGAKLQTPVLILTAQDDEESVVQGFNAGANDYVRKPFGNKELLARVGALLRNTVASGKQLRFGDLSVSLENRKALYKGVEVELNRREFDVLVYFLQHPDIVVTRDALLQAVDKDGEIVDRTIDSHVSHVRSRLKFAGIHSIQITTIYGIGYRMEKK